MRLILAVLVLAILPSLSYSQSKALKVSNEAEIYFTLVNSETNFVSDSYYVGSKISISYVPASKDFYIHYRDGKGDPKKLFLSFVRYGKEEGKPLIMRDEEGELFSFYYNPDTLTLLFFVGHKTFEGNLTAVYVIKDKP